MNDITCQGTDGRVMTYHAILGSEYTPQETGWVLTMTGGRQPIDPQALSADEVMGDLLKMALPDEAGAAIVQLRTQDMIDELNGREDPAAAQRANDLREELDRVEALGHERPPHQPGSGR